MSSSFLTQHLQAPTAVLTVWCAVCQKKAYSYSVEHNWVTATTHFEVRCHGKIDVVTITSEARLNGIGPIQAFTSEAGEIERLENEDAALAAAGIPDPDSVRLAAEDAALEACGAT